MKRRTGIVLLVLLAIFVIGCCVGAYFFWCRLNRVDDLLEEMGTEVNLVADSLRIQQRQAQKVESKVEGLTRGFEWPDTLRFGNEIIPQTRDVRERFLREFYEIRENRPRVYLWLLRGPRYFPMIESMLAEMGLPDDLKYVCLVESDLNELAYSRVGACGIWQFMPATARRYGLRVDELVDERRDPEKATLAARRYLADLYREFQTWSLALPGYNDGEGDIYEQLTSQRVVNFYDLYLLRSETDRYFFCAVVAKYIYEGPEKYGFFPREEDYFLPIPTDSVRIRIRLELVPVWEIAQSCSTTYREIRLLNRWIIGDYLPRGEYRLKIPKGKKELFLKSFKQGKVIDHLVAAR